MVRVLSKRDAWADIRPPNGPDTVLGVVKRREITRLLVAVFVESIKYRTEVCALILACVCRFTRSGSVCIDVPFIDTITCGISACLANSIDNA